MKNVIVLLAAALCLFFSSCHRPVAYFQPTPRPAAARLSVEEERIGTAPADRPNWSKSERQTGAKEWHITELRESEVDSVAAINQPVDSIPQTVAMAVVSLENKSVHSANMSVERRMQRIQSLMKASTTETADKQPEPKPKKKLKLGNQIRQSLGMRLRPELNWWQRISWKLKASVLVILVAVVFAILHITILAIIFGILGALLLMSGLKKSFKVRRPWF